MHHDRHPPQRPPLRLDAWDRKFEGLQRRIDRLGAGGRRGLETKLLDVRRKKNDLERRLRDAAHGTRAGWDDLRDDLMEAVRDFRHLTRQVRERARKTG